MWEIEGVPHWLGLVITGVVGFLVGTMVLVAVVICLWFWGVAIYSVYEFVGNILRDRRWAREVEKERERRKGRGGDC